LGQATARAHIAAAATARNLRFDQRQQRSRTRVSWPMAMAISRRGVRFAALAKIMVSPSSASTRSSAPLAHQALEPLMV